MVPTFFAYLAMAVLGLVFASYLNAWIWRVYNNAWVFGGRSFCVHCSRQLAWFENIPLVSFVFLRGQCRTCFGLIPRDYFGLECILPLLFVGLLHYHLWMGTGEVWLFARDLVFLMILAVVFVYDAKYQLVLSGLVYAGSLIGFAFNFFVFHYTVASLLLGVLLGGGFFLVQYLVSRGRWIGGGDIRLGVMMGLWLGWPGIVVALFLSYVIGAFYAVLLVVLARRDRSSAIPFGTFLTVGTLITLLFGHQILTWYLGLLGK